MCDEGYLFDDAARECVPDCECLGAPASDGSAAPSCAGPGVCACDPTCVYGGCVAGQCECWAGYGGPVRIVPTRTNKAPMPSLDIPRTIERQTHTFVFRV